jgi:hypothetical protein
MLSNATMYYRTCRISTVLSEHPERPFAHPALIWLPKRPGQHRFSRPSHVIVLKCSSREDLLLPENPAYQPEIILPMVDLDLLSRDPKAFKFPFVVETTFDSIGFSPNVSIGPLPLELPSDSIAEFQDADLLEDSRWNSRPSILNRLDDGLLDDDILVVDDDGVIIDVGPIAQTGITTPQNQRSLRASHGTRDRMEGEDGGALGTVVSLHPTSEPHCDVN